MIPTVAPVRAESRPVGSTWVFDVCALSVTLLLLAALAAPGDGDLPGRSAVALFVLTFAPGWATVRLLGAPRGVLAVLSAFALSVSALMITSLITVAWLDWNWEPVALAWSRFDEATRRRVRARYTEAIEPWKRPGGYEIPGEFLVVAARRA